jgi:hypothetical protein
MYIFTKRWRKSVHVATLCAKREMQNTGQDESQVVIHSASEVAIRARQARERLGIVPSL